MAAASSPERLDLGGRTLRAHTARGTLVNGAFTVGVSTLGLLRGFIVAGFLAAADYGVWGIIVVGFGTLGFLRNVGVADRYVQQDEPDQQLAFQRAFSVEAVVTAGYAVLLLAAIPVVAAVYDTREIVVPALVLLLLLPATLLQAPTWSYYRRMDFVRQRRLQAIEPLVAFAVTVGLAAAGTGYWSFVVGGLVGAWAGALVALWAAPYRPAWRLDRATLRAYAGFSLPLFLVGLSGLVTAQSAMITAQHTLGLAGVGAITLATTISLYAHRVDDILTATIYPAICAVKDRRDLLLEAFVKSNRLALMWGVPFGVGAALFASDLVAFGIGERWRPAVPLIAAISLVAAAEHVGFNWSAFFRARGDTRPIAAYAIAVCVLFLAAPVPLMIADGLEGYALGLGVVAAGGLVLRGAFLRRIFPGFNLAGHLVRAAAPVAPAVAAVLGLRALEGGERTLGLALGELALFVAACAAATWLLERRLLREITAYLRRPAARPAAT